MAAPMSCLSDDAAILVSVENAQKMRFLLEKDGFWDSSRRLQRLEGRVVAIPVKTNILSSSLVIFKGLQEDLKFPIYNEEIISSGYYQDLPCHLVSVSLPMAKKQLVLSPHQRLVCALRERFSELDIPFPEEALQEIPDVWEKHGDLILLPQTSFQSNIWEHCHNLWETVAMVLRGQRVARKGRIKPDEFRSPRVELLLGNDGWVEHRDNGIRYTYDVRHCMFSAGNITEKLRVASFHCAGETVVDLYAGIGYFTLPYLVHAKASMVHACEWNSDSIDALRKNLAINGVQERCIVHQGDNRLVCPRGVADRVNLGLIPTSEDGWPVACAALKPRTGGILHIHGNVTSQGTEDRSSTEKRTISRNGTNLPSGKLKAEGICGCTCTEYGSEAERSLAGFGTARPKQEEQSEIDTRAAGSVGADKQVEGDRVPDFAEAILRECGACEMSRDMEATQHVVWTKSSELSAQKNDPSHLCRCRDNGDVPDLEGHSSSTRSGHWEAWAVQTARRIQDLLTDIHGGQWTADPFHIQHVKSYAPHVDHMVVDVRCTPTIKVTTIT